MKRKSDDMKLELIPREKHNSEQNQTKNDINVCERLRQPWRGWKLLAIFFSSLTAIGSSIYLCVITNRISFIDIVPYEIRDKEVFTMIFTAGFRIMESTIVGFQTIILNVLGLKLENNVLMDSDGIHVNSSLETKALNIKGMKMKGDTLFMHGPDSDEFSLLNPLTITGNDRSFSAMEVHCSGFTIRDKTLFNARGEVISWPEPGESRNSGKEMNQAVLMSDNSIPYIGETEGDMCSDVSIQATCDHMKSFSARSFACNSSNSITLFTCKDKCCKSVSSVTVNTPELDKFEVFGDAEVATLRGGSMEVFIGGELASRVDHVTDIGTSQGKLLFAKDFVLYEWNEHKNRVIARGLNKFTASEYRKQMYIIGDCERSVKTAGIELTCSKERPEFVLKMSNREELIVKDRKVLMGDKVITELNDGERAKAFVARDKMPVLAIFSKNGVKMRKVLKSGKLTAFTLTDKPIADLDTTQSTSRTPVLVMSEPERIVIQHCTNDLCIPNVVFQ